MTFSILALVLARDSHIKPDSEAGELIWVEGWYQGRYGKFHIIIFLSHILHWPFPCIDFYIAKKIFELTNCENKSLRASICTMTLETVCKIYTRRWHLNGNSYSTRRIHLSYHSVSIYLNFIPICWNVLIWLKKDFIHISMHHLSLYFETTAQIPEVKFGVKYGYMRANMDIWGQIRIFAPYLPWGQINNTDFQLLLDMQKRTYCNKICDNIWFWRLNLFTIKDRSAIYLVKKIK